LPDFTDGSLFYHANYVLPKWSRTKKIMSRIDSHIFYK
jgi:spore germination cell wall hydrolase CwlJ-like protein